MFIKIFLTISLIVTAASAAEKEEFFLNIHDLDTPEQKIRCCYYQSELKSSSLILYLQGLQSFVEKNEETITDLCSTGCDVFAFDWRSQGKSSRFLPSEADHQKVHVPSFEVLLQDLSLVVDYIYKKCPHQYTYFMGISMGGHLLLRYFQDRWDSTLYPVSGIILVAPMIDLYTYNCPYMVLYGLGWLISDLAHFNQSYIIGARDYDFNKSNSSSTSTHCNKRARNNHALSVQNPGCVTGGPTWHFMNEMIKSISLFHSDILLNLPKSLWFIAGQDLTVNNYRVRSIIPGNGELVELDDAFHNILNETDEIRTVALSQIKEFVLETGHSKK